LTPDSEDDLSSLSEPSSLNSTPQSESKPPFSPRDFWKEKAGEPVVVNCYAGPGTINYGSPMTPVRVQEGIAQS